MLAKSFTWHLVMLILNARCNQHLPGRFQNSVEIFSLSRIGHRENKIKTPPTLPFRLHKFKINTESASFIATMFCS